MITTQMRNFNPPASFKDIQTDVPIHLLVMTQDRAITEYLMSGICAEHWTCDFARTQTAALRLAFSRRYSAAIIDLDIRYSASDHFPAKIRNQMRAREPILALFDHSDLARKIKLMNLGFDDCLTKPFSMAEVIARIRLSLRQRFHSP